jgi:hypothetical protein
MPHEARLVIRTEAGSDWETRMPAIRAVFGYVREQRLDMRSFAITHKHVTLMVTVPETERDEAAWWMAHETAIARLINALEIA